MIRRAVAALAVVVLAAGACTSGAPEPSPDAGDSGACPDGFTDAIAAWGDVGFTGTITLLRGADVCTTAAGLRDPEAGEPMTGDTVFAIGSVSKSFTAAAVMQLVAEGRLGLDDTAGSLVPGLGGPAASATIAQLLTHTSGLHGGTGEDHTPVSRAEAVDALSALPRTFPAGTQFGYTNGGYTLLALVIDQVTGDYRSYVADHVLPEGAGFWDGEPAARGPRAVGYTEEGRSPVMGQFAGPHWATSGNGDLAMTVPQLAATTAALFRGELLPADATAAIERPRWDHGDGTRETFGWVRFDRQVFGAVGFAAAGGGGDTGHNAIVAYLPDADTAIAIASSTDEVSAEQLMQSIITALAVGEPIPLPEGADATPPDAATVERMTGTYELDGDILVVTGDGTGVAVSASGDAAVDALFTLPTGLSEADVAEHEAGVVALLTGDNAAGEDERRALGESVGGIEDVQLRGTVVDGGELRTYVTVVGGELTLDGWYALDDQGGVAAAQVPADPPILVFDQQRGDTLISIDPTGRRADVRITLDGDLLTLDDGASVATARRTGQEG